jgi:prepilin-type N-terminal cleavage/methylation domain-containing protein
MTDRRGFTLIELLVVTAIIGLLASIALPRFTYMRQRAYVASMISDLRHLVTSQEAFLSAHGSYAGAVHEGPEIPGAGGSGTATLGISPNVSIVITYRGPSASGGEGWSAVATHPGVTDPDRDECGVFVGDVSYSPNAAVVSPATIACY